MGLARQWRWRLYASTGLAVAVPMALLVSLALLTAAGGSFSLASLTQVFAGPSAPPAQPVALGGGAGLGSPGQPGTAAGRGSVPLASALAPVARLPSSGAGSPSSHRRAGGGTHHGGGSNQSGGGHGGGEGGGGGRGSGPPHGRSAHPTVVDGIVNAVTPVTSGLPAPAGPLLTQVAKSTGSQADRILRKLPHG